MAVTLLDRGCTPCLRNARGVTPLHLACQYRHMDIAKVKTNYLYYALYDLLVQKKIVANILLIKKWIFYSCIKNFIENNKYFRLHVRRSGATINSLWSTIYMLGCMSEGGHKACYHIIIVHLLFLPSYNIRTINKILP